jgi:hypothetical protein
MHKKITTLILKPLMLFGTSCALAQQEEHGSHAMMSTNQVGSEYIEFAISCDHAVADEFNRGVALIHSFWFSEAINTFNNVLREDPDCAIAHWGIALGHWGNPFAGQRNAAQLARGQATMTLARATGSPDAREKAYIEAVGELYASDQPSAHYERTVAYENAMAQLVQQYPDDKEAKIFYALAVNQTALPSDQTYSQQLKAAGILEPLFEENPNHPGIAHYIIHAYDHPPLAERALDAAHRYATLAPDAPHALHMPSHTFTRVGMWQESVDTNLRSAEIARQDNDAGSELHALDYQTYAYLQMAQDNAASAVVDHATQLISEVDITAVGATQAGAFAIAAIPARYALERGDYTQAANLVVIPADTPHTQAITHFARALGAARSGNPAAAASDIDMLAELRARAEARQDAYWAQQIDIQWRIANAWVAFASDQREQGISLMRVAAEIEDGTDKAAVTPGPLAPARELLAAMLLESERPELALQEFESTLRKEPNRFRALHGAAQAAAAAGDKNTAQRYYRDLLRIAGNADTDRPELQQARRYLED